MEYSKITVFGVPLMFLLLIPMFLFSIKQSSEKKEMEARKRREKKNMEDMRRRQEERERREKEQMSVMQQRIEELERNQRS